MGVLSWGRRWWAGLEGPAWVTVGQMMTYVVAAAAGVVAIVAGPQVLVGQVGWFLVLSLGVVLVTGGVTGFVSCLRGWWWLERVAVGLCALGWSMQLPSILTAELRPGTRWLFVLLIAAMLLDYFKRYRRIDWAYLDPDK